MAVDVQRGAPIEVETITDGSDNFVVVARCGNDSAMGIAHRHGDDSFNVDVGYTFALGRALQNLGRVMQRNAWKYVARA